jgi:hypothetical protein
VYLPSVPRFLWQEAIECSLPRAALDDDFVIVHLDGMYTLISPDGTQEMQFQDYVVPSSAAWRVVVRQLEGWLGRMREGSGGQ